VEVANRAQTGPVQTSAGDLTFGGDAFYGQYFAGRIDEVRIYNRALSPAEIANDMNSAVVAGAPPKAASIQNLPRITSITSNKGAMRLTVRGPVGFTYSLEVSSDLVHWDEVAAQENTTGEVLFDEEPTTNTVRFYRAVSRP
jgi:hypothetical protein